MTDAQYLTWLASAGRIPCVLVEVVARVAGVETTRYLSNTGYTSGPTDAPANTHYLGVITDGGKVSEAIPLDGGAGLSFSDAELANASGEFDAWLADVWVNRTCKVYVGDQRWPRSDFRLVFDGITADLDSRQRDVLNIKMRDKLQRLNNAVTDTKLGGASQNADRLLPITLGEVTNIEPLLIDKALLKYQVHPGAIEAIIEVRDNGVPVASTPTLASGTFTLSATPAGVVTCSVQGDKPAGVYSNTISKLVQRLATGYGTDPFIAGDLDAANLAAFDAANPQPVGRYLSDRENVLAVCQQLADSVGAQVVCSATGQLRLLQISLPATGTPTAVSSINMVDRSLEISQRVPVRAAVKLGYCHNGTAQSNLQTGIPPEHKNLFGQEWMTVTKFDAAVAGVYKLAKEPPPRPPKNTNKRSKSRGAATSSTSATSTAGLQAADLVDQPNQENTLLLTTADANTETTRRLNLWKTPRTVFRYVGLPELLLEPLGGYQTLTHARFNLAGGVSGQIVSVERDWLRGRATFEVLT